MLGLTSTKARAAGKHQPPERCPVSKKRELSPPPRRKAKAGCVQNWREQLPPQKTWILISITNVKNGKKV